MTTPGTPVTTPGTPVPPPTNPTNFITEILDKAREKFEEAIEEADESLMKNQIEPLRRLLTQAIAGLVFLAIVTVTLFVTVLVIRPSKGYVTNGDIATAAEAKATAETLIVPKADQAALDGVVARLHTLTSAVTSDGNNDPEWKTDYASVDAEGCYLRAYRIDASFTLTRRMRHNGTRWVLCP